jgi:hypothetical protein
MPLAYEVGTAAVAHVQLDDARDQNLVAPAFEAFIGNRVDAHGAFGVHLGASYVAYTTNVLHGSAGADNTRYEVEPLDLGLAVELEHGGLWIAPWLGAHFSIGSGTHSVLSNCPVGVPLPCTMSTTYDNVASFDYPSLGFSAGLDLTPLHHGHLSLYVAGQTGLADGGMFDYRALGLGIAYRE